MEEHIYKILNEVIYYMDHDRRNIAKKIATHFVLFTEWCIEWVYYEEPNYHLIIRNRTHIDKPLGTLLEVYQYWLINIHNKLK